MVNNKHNLLVLNVVLYQWTLRISRIISWENQYLDNKVVNINKNNNNKIILF